MVDTGVTEQLRSNWFSSFAISFLWYICAMLTILNILCFYVCHTINLTATDLSATEPQRMQSISSIRWSSFTTMLTLLRMRKVRTTGETGRFSTYFNLISFI